MGHDKIAIRQNVLDGDNLPNAILNAVIAGYDAPTIVQDTIETLQKGDVTSYMFQATPSAIDQFVDAFVEKARQVTDELRKYEFIDAPIIRRMGAEAMNDGSAVVQPTEEVDSENEGIDVESAEEEPTDDMAMEDESLETGDDELSSLDEGGPEGLGEEDVVRKIGVTDLDIKAILDQQKPTGDGSYEGKVAIIFPESLNDLGTSGVNRTLAKLGIDSWELAAAVSEYVMDFIGRTSRKYFGGMDAGSAEVEFTDMAWSGSNDRAIVSTYVVSGAGAGTDPEGSEAQPASEPADGGMEMPRAASVGI